jgi:thiol-disulfide isomerase/thioredoxin
MALAAFLGASVASGDGLRAAEAQPAPAAPATAPASAPPVSAEVPARGPARADNRIGEGDMFPDLTQFPIEGKLPEHLKGRVLVVDFWASWCGPCRETFPALEELHRRYAKQGLVVLAVNVDQSRAAMEEFLKENQVGFAVVRDKSKKLVAAVRPESLPRSYVVDRQGRVRLTCIGFHRVEDKRRCIRQIDELLAAAPATTP